jgi:hypothetical protein
MKEVESCMGLALASKIIAEGHSSDSEAQDELSVRERQFVIATLSDLLANKLQNIQSAIHETYVRIGSRTLGLGEALSDFPAGGHPSRK